MKSSENAILSPSLGLRRIQNRFKDFLLELSEELKDPEIVGEDSRQPIILQQVEQGYCFSLVCLPAHNYRRLTPREREVTALVQQGLANGEIAAKLHARPATVATHLRSIFKKLRIHSRRELLLGATPGSASPRPEMAAGGA